MVMVPLTGVPSGVAVENSNSRTGSGAATAAGAPACCAGGRGSGIGGGGAGPASRGEDAHAASTSRAMARMKGSLVKRETDLQSESRETGGDVKMPGFGTSTQRQALFNGTPLASRNRLLAALPEAEYAQLAPLLRRDHLELRQTIFEYDAPVERVYFPESAVVSVVGVMSGAAAAQSAIVGNEGFVGLPVFLGADRMSAQTFCQIPGEAVSLSADEFRQAIARGGRLPILLGRYTQALFTLMSQSSACARAHELRQRCARWLLLTHDRVGTNDFPLTQLFLAQ